MSTLSNGKTIEEQRRLDYEIACGIYPSNTPIIYNMHIVSNTIPPQENYSCLNEDEKSFFTHFSKN